MATNPILTELSSLSPGAQQALMQAHTAASATPAAPPMQPPKIDTGTRQATAGLQAPGAPPPPAIGGSMGVPSMPNLSAPAPPIVHEAGKLSGDPTQDSMERSRLLGSGSGVSQISHKIEGSNFGQNHPGWGKVLGIGAQTLATIGDTAGRIAAPGLERMIPGTEGYHQNLLGKANTALTGDINNTGKEAQTASEGATTAHTQAETAGLPQEQADTHSLREATVGNLNSETEHRGDVKNSWKELAGYTGPNGEPLEINEGTGETRAANAPQGSHVTSPKETNPQQQTYDSLLKQGLTPMQAYEKIREKPGGTTINQGTWTLDEDPTTGKPILFNSKTGETKQAPAGVAKAGTFAKAQAATAPAKQAVEYADSYKNGIHTGPGDEALMEKYFELAKPSTGFRMSQPQINMEMKARSWAGSLEAHLRHASEGTWFSDEQRNQIIDTMHDLARAKGLETGSAYSGSGGTNPSDKQPIVQHSPSTGQYRYSTDGGKTWQQGQPPTR